MCAVRFVLRVVAFAAVNFPAARAASISLVLAATSAVISAEVLFPAIAARVSPACKRDLIVAASSPIVVAIKVSLAARSALLSAFVPLSPPMPCADAKPAVPNEITIPVASAAATNFFFTFLLTINSNALRLMALYN